MGLLISVLSYFSHAVTTVLAHTEFLAVLAEEEIMYKAGRRSFGGSRRRRRSDKFSPLVTTLKPALASGLPYSTSSRRTSNSYEQTPNASTSHVTQNPAPQDPTSQNSGGPSFVTTRRANFAPKVPWAPRIGLEDYSYTNCPGTPPQLIYVKTVAHANEVIPMLEGTLGFDMEWPPYGPQGKQGKTAVIQVADRKSIVVFHVSMMGCFPKRLKTIIESNEIVKVGANIRGDGNKLYRDFGIHAQNLVELSYVARAADPGAWPTDRKLSSLADLVKAYTRKNLLKGDERMSNWRNALTEKQLFYAANDAYSGLAVYRRLLNIAAVSEREIPPADVVVLIKTSLASPGSSMETIDLTGAGPSSSTAPLYQSAASKRAQPSNESQESIKYSKSSTSARVVSSSHTPLVESTQSTSAQLSQTQPTSTQSSSSSGVKPYQLKAYETWHKHNYTLDELCVHVASRKSSPVQRGTAIRYVLEALAADPSLSFARDRLWALIREDQASFKKYEGSVRLLVNNRSAAI